MRLRSSEFGSQGNTIVPGNRHSSGDGRPSLTIVSKLANWDTRASVRVKPRRVLRDEDADGKLFITPELVPVAQHPLVRRLGPGVVRDLQVQHFYRYLDFTTRLELEVIGGVARDIALDRAGLGLPEVIRADAFKLGTDEAHHAYFSDDLRRQVVEVTGIVPRPAATPPFLRRLRAIRRDLPPDQKRLAVVLFAVVSETLISGILAQLPRDDRVVTAVRAIVADHAQDEGRHSAFFSQFFAYLWPQLGDDDRAALGPLLPQFIRSFLQPDSRAIRRELARLPLSPDEMDAVIAEAYPAARVLSDAREAAAVTINLFAHNGLMDDPRIGDAFREAGLIE
jgi:hypothetical protein